MSKYANPGELRTLINVCRVVRVKDAEGFYSENEIDVFNVPIKVKWVNAHGTEAFQAMQLQLREPATITCRYSPKIKRDCVVYKAGDPVPYEIISIDNVEERRKWMEIKVQRKVAGR